MCNNLPTSIRKRARKGFTLTELIIVVAIISILGTASVITGTKQVAKARIQETTAFLRTLSCDIEDGIMDMGFLDTVDVSNEGELAAVKNYLYELEDKYLSCGFDYSSIAAVSTGNYTGFGITLTGSQDAWGLNYMFFYFRNAAEDSYRIAIASRGPNTAWSAEQATGYVNAVSESWDDDIVVVMLTR